MEKMKDYAYPTIMAEECLKKLHYAVLSKDYTEAQRLCAKTLVWVLELEENLKEMASAAKS